MPQTFDDSILVKFGLRNYQPSIRIKLNRSPAVKCPQALAEVTIASHADQETLINMCV